MSRAWRRLPSGSPVPALPAETGRHDLGFLFVVTYGRSGSTLLQGVLNSIPGYLIRGENRQVLAHLHAFHQNALQERRRQRRQQRNRGVPEGSNDATDAWFGIDRFPREVSLRRIRGLVVDTLLRPTPETRVTGFKEIRWDAEDVDDFVAWLRQVFPGARFVVNTRDLSDVAASKWWADDPDARARLELLETRLLALAESLGDAAYHVRFDDYRDDPGALRPLFAWLGEEYDEERLRAVLATRHSY